MKSFYENGNLRKLENYDSTGVKNGKWTEYYENGRIKIEQHFTNEQINLENVANKNSYGKKTKTFSLFYPNGKLRFALSYSNDKIENGLFIEYYPSGKKKNSGNLKNELRNDKWTEFYESGIVKSSGHFSSGNYTGCGVVPFTAYYEYKIGEWNYYYPNGEIKTYDKRKSFCLAGEDQFFTPGESETIVNYLGWNIQLQICYDLRFPEIVRNRILPNQKAAYDVILYVANWPKVRINAWDALLKARAIENMSYCIGVNRVGLDGNFHEYTGHSAAYDVLGKRLDTIPIGQEATDIVTLTKGHISKYREKLGFLDDRDEFTLE